MAMFDVIADITIQTLIPTERTNTSLKPGKYSIKNVVQTGLSIITVLSLQTQQKNEKLIVYKCFTAKNTT